MITISSSCQPSPNCLHTKQVNNPKNPKPSPTNYNNKRRTLNAVDLSSTFISASDFTSVKNGRYQYIDVVNDATLFDTLPQKNITKISALHFDWAGITMTITPIKIKSKKFTINFYLKDNGNNYNIKLLNYYTKQLVDQKVLQTKNYVTCSNSYLNKNVNKLQVIAVTFNLDNPVYNITMRNTSSLTSDDLVTVQRNVYTLIFEKRTEGFFGMVTFYGISLQNSQATFLSRSSATLQQKETQKPQEGLKLEFLGASTTCGYGNVLADCQPNSPLIISEDVTRSFTTLTAKNLNASEYRIFCWSGVGVLGGFLGVPFKNIYKQVLANTCQDYSLNLNDVDYGKVVSNNAVVITNGTLNGNNTVINNNHTIIANETIIIVSNQTAPIVKQNETIVNNNNYTMHNNTNITNNNTMNNNNTNYGNNNVTSGVNNNVNNTTKTNNTSNIINNSTSNYDTSFNTTNVNNTAITNNNTSINSVDNNNITISDNSSIDSNSTNVFSTGSLGNSTFYSTNINDSFNNLYNTLHKNRLYQQASIENNNLNTNYNFTQYIPDIIIINLGNNDFSFSNTLPYKNYSEGYNNLLNFIYAKYLPLNPKLKIIGLAGVLAYDAYKGYSEKFIKSRPEYGKSLFWINFQSYILFTNREQGCYGHPNVETHKRMADILTNFIITNDLITKSQERNRTVTHNHIHDLDSLDIVDGELVEDVIPVPIISVTNSPKPSDSKVNVHSSLKEVQLRQIKQKQFQDTDSDHITLLNTFLAFVQNKQDKRWCYENYLNYRSLRSAENTCRKALVHGFFMNIAFKDNSRHYCTVKDNQLVAIHPSSGLNHTPEWVIYDEFLLTDNQYIRTVTDIEGER
ncbi:hypothetical protein ABK040_004794 [Willaertia magna]